MTGGEKKNLSSGREIRGRAIGASEAGRKRGDGAEPCLSLTGYEDIRVGHVESIIFVAEVLCRHDC